MWWRWLEVVEVIFHKVEVVDWGFCPMVLAIVSGHDKNTDLVMAFLPN